MIYRPPFLLSVVSNNPHMPSEFDYGLSYDQECQILLALDEEAKKSSVAEEIQ